MTSTPRYRELPTGCPGWAKRPPRQAKAVPAGDPAAAGGGVAAAAAATATETSTCGQAGQTRSRKCEVFPCVVCILERVPRGYSVARRARCSGKFSAFCKQASKPWDISARARKPTRLRSGPRPTVHPATLRRLERVITAAGPSGVSGWFMERSILPRGNRAAVGEQASSKQQSNGDT